MSVGLSFNTKLANEVLADLNAERTAEGLPALSMDTSSAHERGIYKYRYSYRTQEWLLLYLLRADQLISFN